MSNQGIEFYGAKVCLFIGAKILVILRDDIPGILWPAHWDFPGGGREGDETPFETVARETMEEVGLALTPADILDSAVYPTETKPGAVNHFMLARCPAETVDRIVLGDEGQEWTLMTPDEYASHSKRIPHFADRMAEMLGKHKNLTRGS